MPAPSGRGRPGRPAPLWLPDGDVAAMLNVHRSTVWRWLDQGLIPAPRRIGGRTLWSRSEVELFSQCRSMAEFRRAIRSP
jgi:excisionase family DNA binding protein